MLLALPLAFAQEAPPIVNGTTTSDYPEVVFLYMEYNGGMAAACTGELIADDWVLTAAHCVSDDGSYRLQAMTAFIGADTNSLEQQSTADDWYPNPSYDANSGYYDIGLVHLSRTFRGVPLMGVNKDTIRRGDVGNDYTIVGYGITSDNDTSSVSRKRYAEVPLSQYDDLLLIFEGDPDNQNACHGDSGGPALEIQPDGGYEVAGIIDFGYPGYYCEDNGVATARVDGYLDWIEGYTPVYSYDELYGGDADTDTDTDSDTDSDTDTDTDADSDADSDTDTDSDPATDLEDDPVRPKEVGENYASASGCGCSTGGEPAMGAGLLLVGAALTRRRR